MTDIRDSSIADSRPSLSAVGSKTDVMGSPSTVATETTLGPTRPVFKEFSQDQDANLLDDYLPLFGDQQQLTCRVFHWEIDSWAGLSSTSHSAPFTIAHSNFQIHLVPNIAEPHTLFRLTCQPADNTHLCIFYCLAISNAKHPEVHWKRAIQHRYTTDTLEQGSQELIEHSLLVDASHEHGRPIIENDCVRVSVYIRIIKEQTKQPTLEPEPTKRFERTRAIRQSILRTVHINSLYTPPPQMIRVRIITSAHTANHQDFDIYDFDSPGGFDTLLPRSHQVSELIDTYTKHTDTTDQLNLWILNRRETGTLRCSHPIETTPGATLGDLVDMHSFSSDLAYFYCEPGLSKPGLTNLVHLKFYDGAKDRIVGLGHFRLSFFKKLRLSFPDLCKIANLPRGTQLLLFEEVKPGEIRKLDSEWTLKYAGLGPGDIICFQVKPDGYDGMSRYQRGKFPSVVSFFGRKAK